MSNARPAETHGTSPASAAVRNPQSLPPLPPAAEPGRLIRLPATLSLVPLGRTAWLDLVKRNEAPQPVKIGRATFWVEREVLDWIAERVRAHRGQQATS